MTVNLKWLMSNKSEAAIFGRILSNSNGEMSQDLARYILTLGFSESDQYRMEELAQRNQDNTLSTLEHQELMNFVRTGHILALLHSKARKSLGKREVS
jgi:hypothetical protein